MGVKERREREKENLRQEILNAASQMFAEDGYENVSMRKIADRIEYSPTTIYLYFKDKNDLLNQICEETFAMLYAEMQKIEKQSKNALDCLQKGIRAYIEFGLEHPNHYEVTFTSPLWNKIEEEKEYKFEGSMGERTFGYLRSIVAQAVEEGGLKRGDVDAMSQVLWAGMHGVTSLLNGHSDFPFVSQEKLIDCLIDSMLNGLKAR